MGCYIKDMEMPARCCECDLERCGEYEITHECAMLYKGWTNSVRESGRLKNCPLVEVDAPHGRLVDADKLRTDIVECMEVKDPDYEWKEAEGLKAAIEYVEKAETVIEAEGMEE